MSRSRPLFLLTLLASSTALTGLAYADAPSGAEFPEVGGWGQAWGEDERPVPAPIPARLPPRPVPSAQGYTPPPPAANLPRRSSAVTANPASVATHSMDRARASLDEARASFDEAGSASYPEVGGWGQAWGEDDPVSAPRPRSVAQPLPHQESPLSRGAESPPPRLRAVVSPEVVQAGQTDAAPPRRRGVTVSMEPADINGDAVGMRRPPRIIPRAVERLNRREEGEDPPVHMEADQVIYDREFSVVTAKGRVEMIQSGRTIAADTVSYNLKQDVMAASGNVVLTEPTGEVTFADYFELTGDFKSGVAANIRLILADNSRLAAQSAQRVGGDRTDFDRAVYTACEPCRDDPTRTPIWQAKAQRVTHNQAEAQIEYRDAWIELAGIPVLYTPYMSHPDPTVKRKSGFLAPSVGFNSTLGPSFTAPYFFVMSDQEDITLVPRFMLPKTDAVAVANTDASDLGTSAMQHLHLLGEHRWRGTYGEAKTQASITADKSSGDIRGHVESKGMVELDRTWRAGWQAQYQSDNVYRDLYRIRTDNDRPWRLTRPYVEGFGRRNYAMAEAMSFQGSRVISDGSKIPVVLPHLIHQALSDPGWAGSYWSFDSDVLSYTRSQGTVGQRISQRTAFNLPLTSPDGQVMALSASMRGDGYRAENLSGYKGDVTSGRAIPEVALNWRYPFSRTGTSVSQVIEPIAMVAMSPNAGSSAKIPNEDSLAFELDETNVLRPNRLVGLDRVEGGLRGGYGLRWAAYPARGGRISIQGAQGWRRQQDSTFGPNSGFTDTLSDYLGRVDVVPSGSLSFTNRVRADKTSLALRRNESSVSVGPAALNVGVAYGYLSATSNSGGQIYPRRQYINYSVRSSVSQHWLMAASMSQDLADNGGTLNWNAKTSYNDECFSIIASMNRYYSDAPGLLSGYNAMLTVVLKTLGEAPVGLF